MTIYLDFDGTVVEHEYPYMGRYNPGSMEVIKKLQEAGHEIILNTYRADLNDGTLEDSLELLNEHSWKFFSDGVSKLDPITNHTSLKIHPREFNWEIILESGILFIDDIAVNMPLRRTYEDDAYMVDWEECDRQFELNGLYNKI